MDLYRTIIFDLDGTLIDSAPDLHAAANVALSSVGRDPVNLAQVTSFIGNGIEKLVERCLIATGGTSQDVFSMALTTFRQSYDSNMTTLTRPYPGVVDCLTRLAGSGVVMGICTNKPMDPARTICDRLELSRFFKVIAGAEAGKPKKPAADPLLNTIARLNGHRNEVLYVGDSSIDHETARNAGVAFRLFSGGYLNSPITDLQKNQVFDSWDQRDLFTA